MLNLSEKYICTHAQTGKVFETYDLEESDLLSDNQVVAVSITVRRVTTEGEYWVCNGGAEDFKFEHKQQQFYAFECEPIHCKNLGKLHEAQTVTGQDAENMANGIPVIDFEEEVKYIEENMKDKEYPSLKILVELVLDLEIDYLKSKGIIKQ